jgi:molybdopterin-guanine dinucleotide biosynthesis protein A
MGGVDKAFLVLGGKPLVAHAIARLGPQVDRIAISANGDPARFAGFGCPVLADAGTAGQGPLAGVLAGLEWARGCGASALVTVAVDTPFFPADLAERLVGAGGGTGRVVLAADDGGVHPTFALWPVVSAPQVTAAFAAGRRRVEDVARSLGCVTAGFGDAGEALFFNVNTPGDLAAAGARHGA